MVNEQKTSKNSIAEQVIFISFAALGESLPDKQTKLTAS